MTAYQLSFIRHEVRGAHLHFAAVHGPLYDGRPGVLAIKACLCRRLLVSARLHQHCNITVCQPIRPRQPVPSPFSSIPLRYHEICVFPHSF
jgi:hypothetical protein